MAGTPRPIPTQIEGAPNFGKNVIILDDKLDSKDTLNEKIRLMREISKVQTEDGSEFAHDRYAIFFKKGKYNFTVDVGYYMTVHGLGEIPDDVTIRGQVRSPGSSNPATPQMALNNFWRGAENLAIEPVDDQGKALANVWAVSQATFMRRVHVKGDLWLWALNGNRAGESSGGFIANSSTDGTIYSGSQQQFLTRNVSLSSNG